MYRAYYRPKSVAEALALLQEGGGRARVLAGGTDLMLQLKKGELSCDAVVDISGVKDLRYIREEGGRLYIGALSTHTDLAESALLEKEAPLLAAAARSVGSLQIRNVGTVGGNVVNAQPAADTAVPLMALKAVATIVSPAGVRQVFLDDLYRPEGGVKLDPTCELLTEFSFVSPRAAGAGAAFGRVARRRALALPVFNTAVLLVPGAGRAFLTEARIVMGPVARLPLRARQGERVLLEQGAGEEIFLQAAAAASLEAAPRDSVFRGSARYRKKLARVIVYRTLLQAWENACSRVD